MKKKNSKKEYRKPQVKKETVQLGVFGNYNQNTNGSLGFLFTWK
jgi:hypothetical protein